MKSFIIVFCSFVIMLLPIGCKQERPGTAVFYTNIQSYLDCGAFEVNIYIGDKHIGSIAGPFLGDTLPECINTDFSLVFELEPGYYNCKATGCSSIFSIKKFNIVSDSCTYVFFDHTDFKNGK